MRRALLPGMLLLLLAPVPARASAIPPGVDEAEYLEAAATILCDCGCHPQSIHDCTCGRAAEMRDAVAADIRSGRTGEEVVAAYVAKYGEKIRIAPTGSGFNLLAWLGPGLAFLVGAGALALVLRRWKRTPAEAVAVAPGPSPAADDPYLARLRRELSEDR